MRNDFESNYLMHWGLKKGAKAPNHKYYERVEKNGKYLYFYTQAEYEAWLHQGNSALETAKEKGKELLDKAKNKLGSLAKDSNSKQTLANTKQNLVNAVNTGYGQAANLLAMAQKQLTKSNAQQVLDRGNKAISSILNTTSNTVSNVSNKAQNTLKATSADIQKKAQTIANNAERTIKNAGRDTQKVMSNYISKGNKAINSALSKASNMTLSSATKKVGGVGTAILTALAATAAVAAVAVAAKKIYDKVEEWREKKYWEGMQKKKEAEKWFEYVREQKERKKETDARNEARRVEQRRKEMQEDLVKKFSKDAEDSVKEDYIRHNDIPVKKEETSRNDDMMAVNQGNFSEEDVAQKVQEMNNKWSELYNKYLETGDYSDYEKAEIAYNEFLKLYNKNYGYLNNCANCTLTYDLRRRGYDVDAPWNHMGTDMDTITDWYKMDPEKDVEYWESDNKHNDWQPFTKEESAEIVQSMTEQYPEGAYGHFVIYWSGGGAHDCVWSKENGKIIIRDCQSGEIVNPHKYLQKSYEVSYFRADDKELSDLVYNNAHAENINNKGENMDDAWYYERERYDKDYKHK